MEFGIRHDTTDTTDFCPHQLVTDLLRGIYGETDVGLMDLGKGGAGKLLTCCGLATRKLL